MAIQFARARYISRSSGGSAVRSAAYNERTAITAERTGELFYFRNRDAPEHHEVLLPEGAGARFADSAVLWNTAEAAEKRRDAQVAREIVVALPADAGISGEDRLELVRSFADQHFVAKGLAVQLDLHQPHEGMAEAERANWHAHLLITTRRLDGNGFSAKKARDLDPEVRHAGGRAIVADGELWGEVWRDHQNRYFREHGLELTVDPVATHPGPHIGPVRMRRDGSEIVARAEEIRQANEIAAHDPDQVLQTLTRHNATFTARELDRFLDKHLADPDERDIVRAQVLTHADLLPLYDWKRGETAGRFTTQAVRAQELAVLGDAAALAKAPGRAMSAETADTVRNERQLRPDQRDAFDHATAADRLALIAGRAGTGKSYTLAAIHDAYARDGRQVIGLAPTNTVAQDLGMAGFTDTSTVHAALFLLKNGRTHWGRNTVLVVDEAAMLDARITGEVLRAARKAGAKVILAGDDRQLASIERGGLFSELRQRHGAAEITEVTRQRVDWQRQAARDLAEGRFAEAVTAFDRGGAITWTRDQGAARTALVAAWTRDTAVQPDARRFVFAYTNRDVDALNAELRQVRRDRGELSGPEVELETKHGVAPFAIGDRVQFTDTLKAAGLYNGNAGTITELDPDTGRLAARLDNGRDVAWSAAEFQGFRHGYAGTIYKGQGKTLDHTYLYHTRHWRRAASYVALTRQRQTAQVFVGRTTARDARALAWQMGRDEVKSASLAWATREEVPEASLQRRARADRVGLEGYDRAMTLADAARLVSPDYAAAVAAVERVRGEAAQTDKPYEDWQRQRQRWLFNDAQRWQKMGAARQALHQSGLYRDPEKTRSEDAVSQANAMLDKLGVRRAALRDRLAYHEREATAALERVRPAAQAELVRRQERAGLARATLEAEWQRDFAQERVLQQNARADRVGPEGNERAMTLADAARLVSPDYAAANAHVTQLRGQAKSIEESRADHAEALRQHREAGARRWQEMGFLRQALHKSGTAQDPSMGLHETNAQREEAALDQLEPRRAEVARQLPVAERVESAALAPARPAAEAELARRQQRAGLARSVLEERQQRSLAREREVWQRELSRGRSGWER
jgi:Ti-type conjugative transfer relaxase TraA